MPAFGNHQHFGQAPGKQHHVVMIGALPEYYPPGREDCPPAEADQNALVGGRKAAEQA